MDHVISVQQNNKIIDGEDILSNGEQCSSVTNHMLGRSHSMKTMPPQYEMCC